PRHGRVPHGVLRRFRRQCADAAPPLRAAHLNRRAGILAAVALAAAAPALASTSHRSRARRDSGTVYIESNSKAPESNEILAFSYKDGSLSAQHIRRFPTGGSGSHDLSNSGVLDADQEVITNPRHTLLFAVNSSSDTIAVFHIEPDGGLSPVAGSPFPSNGKAPSSVGLPGNTLIVA